MSRPTILVAEDDPVLREAYRRKFVSAGYDITTAEDGESAATMLHTRPPDVLICDIMMPKNDGWWLLQQFPKGKRTFPVIMLTNLADDETRERCGRLADGYFVKKDMTLLSLVEMTKNLIDKKAVAR